MLHKNKTLNTDVHFSVNYKMFDTCKLNKKLTVNPCKHFTSDGFKNQRCCEIYN